MSSVLDHLKNPFNSELIHRRVSSHVSGSQVEIWAFHLCLHETEDHKMQSSPGSVEFTQGWNLIPCSKGDKMMNDFNTVGNYWSRGHVLNGMIHTLFLPFFLSSVICTLRPTWWRDQNVWLSSNLGDKLFFGHYMHNFLLHNKYGSSRPADLEER